MGGRCIILQPLYMHGPKPQQSCCVPVYGTEPTFPHCSYYCIQHAVYLSHKLRDILIKCDTWEYCVRHAPPTHLEGCRTHKWLLQWGYGAAYLSYQRLPSASKYAISCCTTEVDHIQSHLLRIVLIESQQRYKTISPSTKDTGNVPHSQNIKRVLILRRKVV